MPTPMTSWTFDQASGWLYPDRQQETPVAHCEECGGEIYPGEKCFHITSTDRYFCYDCISEVVAAED
ncbi:MAG: hypothetical protein LUH03_09730 [Oscillospiraceae bacterium]|nr:hypothetical protein [Oscillospiraceae bacterium]